MGEMNMGQEIKRRFTLILGVVIVLTVISTIFGLAWPILDSRAAPTLPPRDRPSQPEPDDDDDDDGEPDGAFIELQVRSARSGLFARVEWQDSAGGWHTVEGWTGSLTDVGTERWWVAPKDFGKTPFRWVVTEGAGGPVLGISPDFDLPHQPNTTTQVTVSPGS